MEKVMNYERQYRSYEKQYTDLLEDVLANGERTEDRTGTGTISVLSRTLRIDLQKEFPILTRKKVRYDLAIGEMLWILNGETNVEKLRKRSNLKPEQRTIWCADLEKYKKRSLEYAEANGFGFRVSIWQDKDERMLTIDTLYGVGVLRKEFAVVVDS